MPDLVPFRRAARAVESSETGVIGTRRVTPRGSWSREARSGTRALAAGGCAAI